MCQHASDQKIDKAYINDLQVIYAFVCPSNHRRDFSMHLINILINQIVKLQTTLLHAADTEIDNASS